MIRRRALAWIVAASSALALTCAPGQPTPTAPGSVTKDPGETIAAPPRAVADPTKHRVEAAIDNIRNRDLLTTNGFWTIFHGILGLGPSVTLRDPVTGERHNAIDFIASGQELRGLRFLPTKHGLDVQMGPMMVGQGHQDQYVAEMIQWGMKGDKPFIVFGKDYTFMDFVRQSQMRASIKSNQELGWAILVVAQFFGTEAAWTNEQGEKLHLHDLLKYELDLPMDPAACGGTHRLFGLTWCHHLHLKKGGKNEGIWQRIAENTAKHIALAKQYRNPDGSLSTNFFRGPGNVADKELRINTTGHVLEWLALALSDQEIKEPWVQETASALALQILELEDSPIVGGALYHAVHGLLMYYARVYGPEKLGPNAPVFPK